MTTKSDKAWWDRVASLGCVACLQDGIFNTHVSIHHTDGRTKPGAHRRVLPLCGPHHQTGGMEAPAIHPWKARWEAKYGTQAELLEWVAGQLSPSNQPLAQ